MKNILCVNQDEPLSAASQDERNIEYLCRMGNAYVEFLLGPLGGMIEELVSDNDNHCSPAISKFRIAASALKL